MIVADASLAVKWLLWESDTPAALSFLKAFRGEVCAPDVVFIEVAGAIVRRANQDKSLHADALRALEKWSVAWSEHVLKGYRVTQRRLFTASSMALQIGHPLKDCIYLALAEELGCDLATCDRRFKEKAASLSDRVKLLAEYQR